MVIYIVRQGLTPENNLLFVEGELFHYLFTVRRCRKDTVLALFNGQSVFLLECEELNKRTAVFRVTETHEIQKKRRHLIMVHAAADVSGIESAVKGGTEAGADTFIFWDAERSNTSISQLKKKQHRFSQIIESAASQCRRRQIPDISFSTKEEIFSLPGTHIVFHPDVLDKQATMPLIGESGNIYVWIGPEGGFTDTETAFFREKGCQFFTFNAPLMRIETAAVLAAGTIRHLMGYVSDICQAEE